MAPKMTPRKAQQLAQDLSDQLDVLSLEYGDLLARRRNTSHIEERLNALADQHNELMDQVEKFYPPTTGWACFHCGHRFFDQDKARAHFGTEPTEKPKCTRPK